MKRLALARIAVLPLLFFLFIALVANASAAAEPLNLADFESLIKTDVKNGFPGAQLAVLQNGELIYSNAWGYTRPYNSDGFPNPDKTHVTTDTLYDIGGDTSALVTTYCLQHLVTSGQLSFDTKIVDVLGEEFVTKTFDYRGTAYEADLPDYETMLYWKQTLTVENVLRYQSGLPVSLRLHGDNYDFVTGDYEAETPNPFYNASGTKVETLEKLCLTPLLNEPGTITNLTDTDYILLTFVIEKITGEPLNLYFRHTFVEPLNLFNLTFTPLDYGFQPSDCAATEISGNTRGGLISFTRVRTEVVQGEVHDEMSYYAMEGVSGHAGLFANAEDLARLAYLMLDDQGLFSSEVIAAATSPNSDNADFGMGWRRRVATDDNLWLFGSHASPESFGIVSFTHCTVSIDPTNSLVIIYLTNSISSPIGFTDPDNPVNANAKFLGNDFDSAAFNAPIDYVYEALGLF